MVNSLITMTKSKKALSALLEFITIFIHFFQIVRFCDEPNIKRCKELLEKVFFNCHYNLHQTSIYEKIAEDSLTET